MRHAASRGAERISRVAPIVLWGVVIAFCVLPLIWVGGQLLFQPFVWTEAKLDAHRLQLLLRTIGFSLLTGMIATAIALPVSVVIGRGSALARSLAWLVVPVTLLMPSIVYAYGWSQLLRLLNITPIAQSPADVLRCVWSLATWLWPVPAVLLGLSLRRVDQNVQQQALLDGALARVLARQMLAPAVASIAIVSGLAAQEFAVYEPTGISVLATEIRMVYETGALSSNDSPITQSFGAGATGSASISSQAARSGAAVAVALPGLVVVVLGAGLAAWWCARASLGESIETGPLPSVLRIGSGWSVASTGVMILAVVAPLVSLVLSLKQHRALANIWDEFQPQLVGSILLSAGAGMVALLLAGVMCVRPSRLAVASAMLSFLVGGQILAIALVRIYNHAAFEAWLYNGPGIVVIAYVARFGWIALLAGAMTWAKPLRELRDLASVDGADAAQTARWIIFPLAWPTLVAAALFVMVLGLTEVPATVLLCPQRPPMFTPMLMQWVHMLRSDPMIEGSLLLVAFVLLLGTIGAGLIRLGLYFTRDARQGAGRA